jgi:hypothetical protein
VKKVQKPAGPGAIAAGGGLAAVATSEASAPETSKGKVKEERTDEEPESYSATGIDNALDLMEVVTAKMDKASVGQQAAGIERHPEVGGLMSFSLFFIDEFHLHSGDSRHACIAFEARLNFAKFRMQAAFEAYQERELPIARKEVGVHRRHPFISTNRGFNSTLGCVCSNIRSFGPVFYCLSPTHLILL